MKFAVIQPSYLPWRGYFHQIQKADLFVFYDDVQFDKHGWRNRNRIKGPNGSEWITIPVLSKSNVSQGLAIKDVKINPSDKRWRRKHWSMISQYYGKSDFFSEYSQLVAPFLEDPYELLADLTVDLTIAIARKMGIQTEFHRSSDLSLPSDRNERLIAIAKHFEATDYISGPSAEAYLDAGAFEEAGINVEFMTYDYPEYPQLFPPFDPQVSILDLLFAVGPKANEFIWRDEFGDLS